MEKELKALESALGDPVHPVTAVVGGAKVSSKLDVLSNLVTKVDHLIIGGGMANTCVVPLNREVCLPWDAGPAGHLVCRLIMPRPPESVLLLSSTVCIWNRTPMDIEVRFIQSGRSDGSVQPVIPFCAPCAVDARLVDPDAPASSSQAAGCSSPGAGGEGVTG